MRKKLTILFALLCASMMSWATDYCHTEMTIGGKTIYLTCQEISAGNYQLKVECNEAMSGLGGSFCEVNGVGGYQLNAEGHFTLSADGKTITCDIASSSAPRVYTPLYVLIDGEKNFGEISDASWAACGGGSTPDPDPDPTPDPDPNSYTAGGHTIHLEAYHVNDIYTLNITSTDNMEGLGGSFWNVNGVGADMRSNSGENSYTVSGDKKTITCQVQSSSAPNIYTPLYVLMPGEVNFGNVTLNWEDRTPITSEYCNYQGPETQQDGHYYAISFETDPSGNVVITIGNGTGAGACSFRNGGFEGGNNGLDNFVVSDDNFATTTPAADYFTVTRPSDGDLQYVLTKIADLPAGAKIKHLSAGAIAWREAGTDRWCNPEFIYTYGGTCNKLDAPTNVKIDASNILTFDVVYGAETYTAYVSLGGVEKYSQEVASGDELAFIPYITGDYTVNVVASASGKTDSDPSADVVWHLEAEPIVLGNSEYCEWALPKHNDKDANLTVETNDEGSIICTLSPLSGQTAVFRGQGMKLSAFSVGAMHTPASVYFNRVYTEGGSIVTLTLKDPDIKPGLGEKIYFSDVIECKVEGTNTWPNTSLEYTYGTVCPGLKSVSATPNNAEYGSASVVVKSTGSAPEGGTVVDGTEVTFSAIPKDGYVFVNWSNGETRATFDAVVNSNMNLTANFRALGNIYCNTEVTSTRDDDVHKAYATMKRTSANNYKLVVRSAETLGNFSNTTLQVNGSENLNLNNQGTLTDNNHMLTYEFTSTTPPSMTSGYMYLNVPGSKFTECWFTKLTNIEYEVPCEDENVPVESISLNYTETTIEIGNTKTLVVTFNPVYATDKTITWTSTNSSVASVDNGVVTANAIGTATITAATSNGKTATCAVTVEAVTEKTCWGGGNAFTYQGNPVSYYYAITRNVDKTLTYTAEFSRDVAGLGIQVNVHNDAVYSPMSYDSGSKTATFTTTEKFNTGNSLHGFFYFGGYRTDYYYTIGDECAKPSVAVTGVTINHTSATLMIDETVTLSAEVAPANADDKEIVWENSDPSVASFESSTGLVTALAVGTTTITAKSHADGSIFATCVVKVSSALTPTTWYGYGTFTPQEGLTGFTYSITRNSNRSLTYTIVLDKDPVGFVGELNIKDDGVYSAMTYTPATHTATFTTDENYALDGDVLNKSFWWLKYNGGVDRVNFSYTVGSENDPLPQAVAVDETKDNKAILTTYDGHTVIGVLGRSFAAGNLYTLVLPFDVDAAQTAAKLPGQLTKLNNSYIKENGDLRINFVNVSAVEAGVPYLYQPSANVTNPTFEGVTVRAARNPSEADPMAKYYGIYEPMNGNDLHAKTNAYVLGPDQYLYAVADLPDTQTMKALRAYFVLNFPSTGPGAPKRLAKVVFNSSETEGTTDYENLQTDNTCIKVIVNGQLQIIRDGKTYNAFGQLVK